MTRRLSPASAGLQASNSSFFLGRRQAGRGTQPVILDLAAALGRDRTPSRLQLIYDLETIFHPHPVDLVILTRDTSPLLLHEAFFKGRPLYESSDGLFERGRLRAWKLYLDTARLRAREAQYLKDFVRRMRNGRRKAIARRRS